MPSSGAISTSTSSQQNTALAPCRIRSWQPDDVRARTLPGTANTSRPCSRACFAVIRLPLRLAASTTSTPSESPLIILLRMGKFLASGTVPGANSERISPPSRMAACSCPFSGGYTQSGPVPSTAMVLPHPARAARWASLSMPLARPETVVTPETERRRHNSRVVAIPSREHDREPTTPTPGLESNPASPS